MGTSILVGFVFLMLCIRFGAFVADCSDRLK